MNTKKNIKIYERNPDQVKLEREILMTIQWKQ